MFLCVQDSMDLTRNVAKSWSILECQLAVLIEGINEAFQIMSRLPGHLFIVS